MTLPLLSIRWDCVTDIIDGVGGEPLAEGARCSYAYPGDEAKGQQVWVSNIRGELDLPVMAPGRKPRSDIFTITVQILVTDKRDTTLAHVRVQELMQAVENYLAEHCTLATDLEGVMSARITSANSGATTLPEGPVAIAEIDVEIHTRLT